MNRAVIVLVLIFVISADGFGAQRPYTVVGTGQTKCYDDRQEIAPPRPGQPFHGQDAQHRGAQPSCRSSTDGLTVYDNNTELTWQRSADTNGDGVLSHSDKLTLGQARERPAKLNSAGIRWIQRLATADDQGTLFTDLVQRR